MGADGPKGVVTDVGRHDADRRTGLVQLDATDYLSTGEPQPLDNLAARYPLERKEP